MTVTVIHVVRHQALVYQSEIKLGKHTAKLNWFLRAFPGAATSTLFFLKHFTPFFKLDVTPNYAVWYACSSEYPWLC